MNWNGEIEWTTEFNDETNHSFYIIGDFLCINSITKIEKMYYVNILEWKTGKIIRRIPNLHVAYFESRINRQSFISMNSFIQPFKYGIDGMTTCIWDCRSDDPNEWKEIFYTKFSLSYNQFTFVCIEDEDKPLFIGLENEKRIIGYFEI
jgi:hypothetical protein